MIVGSKIGLFFQQGCKGIRSLLRTLVILFFFLFFLFLLFLWFYFFRLLLLFGNFNIINHCRGVNLSSSFQKKKVYFLSVYDRR